MSITSILLDLILLAAVVVCAVFYAKRGFLAAVVVLVGTLVSIVGAVMAAGYLSPFIFDNFFRTGLTARTAEAVAAQGTMGLGAVLGEAAAFLPAPVVDALVENFGATLDLSAGNAAQIIVDEIVAPLVIPIISVVIFLLVFIVLRLVFGLLRRMVMGVNHVPLLGTANRILGGVVGVFVGLLYVFFILCMLWAFDAAYGADAFGDTHFGDSIVWRMTREANIFAQTTHM